jgi:hypothetical protein
LLVSQQYSADPEFFSFRYQGKLTPKKFVCRIRELSRPTGLDPFSKNRLPGISTGHGIPLPPVYLLRRPPVKDPPPAFTPPYYGCPRVIGHWNVATDYLINSRRRMAINSGRITVFFGSIASAKKGGEAKLVQPGILRARLEMGFWRGVLRMEGRVLLCSGPNPGCEERKGPGPAGTGRYHLPGGDSPHAPAGVAPDLNTIQPDRTSSAIICGEIPWGGCHNRNKNVYMLDCSNPAHSCISHNSPAHDLEQHGKDQ